LKNQIFIEKLGFNTSDKVVIFHIDDMGFSHASNVASFECLDFGVASCGSILVPAPWFLEVASICRKNPKYDVGVHLTLTCEYDLYRWRALSTVDTSTGLIDSEGYLWKTEEEAVANVTAEAAEIEMRTQIKTALEAKIDLTHIDTHMGTVLHPKFIQSYLNLAKEFNLPFFLPKINKETLTAIGLGEHADIYLKLISDLDAAGLPLADHMIIDTMGGESDKVAYYCKRFSEIKPGLTHFLFHPAKMSPELMAITPDSASWRNQDYEAFVNSQIKECIKKNNIKVIGYREIRDYMRNR